MIHLRLMVPRDVPLGMRLKEQAGWNQTEADWQRCLMLQPDGCFVAERDGVAVGTVTTCIFGPIAWIAMVLVDAAVRGQGIGRTLLDHALAFLDSRDVSTVRLDATPLGRPLYEKRGFVEEYTLTRFEGVAPLGGTTAGLWDKLTLLAMRPNIRSASFASIIRSRKRIVRCCCGICTRRRLRGGSWRCGARNCWDSLPPAPAAGPGRSDRV